MNVCCDAEASRSNKNILTFYLGYTLFFIKGFYLVIPRGIFLGLTRKIRCFWLGSIPEGKSIHLFFSIPPSLYDILSVLSLIFRIVLANMNILVSTLGS